MKLNIIKKHPRLVIFIVVALVYILSPYARIHYAELRSSLSVGCGVGTVFLETPSGLKEIRTGLDPIQAFGNKINMDDMVSLLAWRQRTAEWGFGPMSGNATLCYIICNLLGKSDEPGALPVLERSLVDPDGVVSGWSCIALFNLGENNPSFRKTINDMEFPEAALKSASSRGVTKPEWFKTEKAQPGGSINSVSLRSTP